MADADDSQTTRVQARVGAVLKDKWRLDSLLGVGGMAAVYAATHRNGKRVAVKVLHTELSVDAAVRARFLREGYVANRVDHPGAVSVIDDDVAEDGSAFLVMELLEGETVEARCERRGGKLDAAETLSIVDQLLDALAAAHEKGVVHRDLKPENLFLTVEARLKVLDFGIARLRELSASQSGGTRAGSVMGTPAFMAPEQARGRWDDVDERTDLWAVGATMFALLTGRVVHEAETVNEQLLAAMTLPVPPVATHLPSLPAAVAAVVDRALAFDKAARFPDARSMQQAVRLAYEEAHGAPVPPTPRASVAEVSPTLLSASSAAPAVTAGGAQTSPTAAGLSSDRSPDVGIVDGTSRRRAQRNRLVGLGGLSVLVAGALAILLSRQGGAPRQGAEPGAPSAAGEATTASAARPPVVTPADPLSQPAASPVPQGPAEAGHDGPASDSTPRAHAEPPVASAGTAEPSASARGSKPPPASVGAPATAASRPNPATPGVRPTKRTMD